MNNKKALSCYKSSLYQLVYISQIKADRLPVNPILHDIATVSAKQNDKNNLTGVLCYGNGWFFQYLEGSKQTLQQLKENLVRDGRHYNIKFLDFSRLAQRRFTSWRMQLLSSEKPTDKTQQDNGLLPFTPAQWQLTEWQEFLQTLLSRPYTVSEMDITSSSVSDSEHKGNQIKMVIQFLERHVAFVAVQLVLSLLIVLSVYLLIVSG